MKTLCSRSYADISVAIGHINIGYANMEIKERPACRVVMEISAQNLLHRISILTVEMHG